MSRDLRRRRACRLKMPALTLEQHTGLPHSGSTSSDPGLPVKELEGEKAAQVGPHWYSFDPHDTFTDPNTRTTRSTVASSSPSPPSSSSVPKQRRKRLPRECNGLKKLWVFFLESLHNSDLNPSLIEWLDQAEGVFRLKEPHVMAQLWGKAKGNQYMTYDKMGRAIRYCYTNSTLVKEKGKRRTYRFGPNALIRR